VPVENSTEGAINHTLDSFLEPRTWLSVAKWSCVFTITLLIGENTGTTISRVYSHAQSLCPVPQVAGRALAPNVERVAVASNARLQKRVKGESNRRHLPAIWLASCSGLTRIC